ncbi:hypothetical protein OESDEN_16317, partial [Oesophagostomum dentatum]
YITEDSTDIYRHISIDTGECCPGYSKSELGHCVQDIIPYSFPKSVVPRFATAMSLLLIVWILIAVFSLLIAYITLSQRRRDAPTPEGETATEDELEPMNQPKGESDTALPSRPNSTMI